MGFTCSRQLRKSSVGLLSPIRDHVGVSEGREDVRMSQGRDERCPGRGLETLDRLRVLAAMRRNQADPDLGADLGRLVAGGTRLAQQRAERLLGHTDVLGQPELELGL